MLKGTRSFIKHHPFCVYCLKDLCEYFSSYIIYYLCYEIIRMCLCVRAKHSNKAVVNLGWNWTYNVTSVILLIHNALLSISWCWTADYRTTQRCICSSNIRMPASDGLWHTVLWLINWSGGAAVTVVERSQLTYSLTICWIWSRSVSQVLANPRRRSSSINLLQWWCIMGVALAQDTTLHTATIHVQVVFPVLASLCRSSCYHSIDTGRSPSSGAGSYRSISSAHAQAAASGRFIDG